MIFQINWSNIQRAAQKLCVRKYVSNEIFCKLNFANKLRKFHILCTNLHFYFEFNNLLNWTTMKYFELSNLLNWITTYYFKLNNLLNWTSWNNFELNIGLNQFWAKFKHRIESIWVSDMVTKAPDHLVNKMNSTLPERLSRVRSRFLSCCS